MILFSTLITYPVFCDDLAALENGMIEYDEQASPRPEGTVATHSCNEGFSLDGVVERVCLETGQFSETPPTCERKFLLMNTNVSLASCLSPHASQLTTVHSLTVNIFISSHCVF